MADLRDELIHDRRGEDSRITIERHCERHRTIKDRNLERDFESLAPAREAPTARAMRPPSSLAGSVGVYGTCTRSPNGSLAMQISAPPVGEV
jgi:hypothetical protein